MRISGELRASGFHGARAICALGVALGALAIGPSAASAAAGDDARIVAQSTTTDIPSNQIRGVNVLCGPGERAVGGGVASAGGNLTASAPRDDSGTFAGTADGDIPRGWFTEAINHTGAPMATTFYAVCSASSDATIQVEEFTAVHAVDGLTPTRADHFASCPVGQRALGGGVDYAGNILANQQSLRASGPLDQGGSTVGTETGDAIQHWYALVFNSDPGMTADHLHHVAAVCSPTSQATVQATLRGGAVTQDIPMICPAGTRATSGGAISPAAIADYNGSLLHSQPTNAAGSTSGLTTGTVPGGWLTSFGSDGNAMKHSVICDPATPPVAQQPLTVTPTPTGQRAAALKKCKKKKGSARKKCKKRAKRLPV
jgi:hypothetical protein